MDQLVEKANQGDLPHEARLVATVARLLDLHNGRRERGSRSTNVAQQPQVSVAAGYYLWLGLQTIQLLHRHAKQGSSGPVPVVRLHEELSEKIGEVARSDLEYCLSFLSLEREIRRVPSMPASRSSRRCLMGGGQRPNTCASFVSADTCLHGLFRLKKLKWPKLTIKRKTRIMLILQGF
jgi:hypothetical protein